MPVSVMSAAACDVIPPAHATTSYHATAFCGATWLPANHVTSAISCHHVASHQQPQRPARAELCRPLSVDTSVEYEMPPSWAAGGSLLMVHPHYYEYQRHRRMHPACQCELCRFYGTAAVMSSSRILPGRQLASSSSPAAAQPSQPSWYCSSACAQPYQAAASSRNQLNSASKRGAGLMSPHCDNAKKMCPSSGTVYGQQFSSLHHRHYHQQSQHDNGGICGAAW